MDWEIFTQVFQGIALLGGTLGSILFAPRLYKAQKARSAAQERSRREAILAEAAKASRAEVFALQEKHLVLGQQVADQHTAIEALEHWNNRQQEKIAQLETEKEKLQLALAEERRDRQRLEHLVTELRVDKAGLEGQINAYQQMFEHLLVKMMIVPTADTKVPVV